MSRIEGKFHCTVLKDGCSNKVFCGRRPADNWVEQKVFDVIRRENQCSQCRTGRQKAKLGKSKPVRIW